MPAVCALMASWFAHVSVTAFFWPDCGCTALCADTVNEKNAANANNVNFFIVIIF